jgi:glutamate-5-semialdehyde dehydrogenase
MTYSPHITSLTALVEGMPIVFGGDRVTTVSSTLAESFVAGDRLVVVQESGDLLHIPAVDAALVDTAVADALAAFAGLGSVTDAQVTAFYDAFAARLEDDTAFAPVLAANNADVDDARTRGRSTTRLVLSPAMRSSMVDGLRAWRDAVPSRDSLLEYVEHDGWTVEQRRAPLGVVGFVFEGRPNVFADATGVLRSGNTVVFRIGSDALRTARAIISHAVEPALAAAGLPRGSVRLLDAPSRATGWALFSHPQLGLAVARGSGEAVAQLGAVARQAGIPVSLHGTGGAWLVAGEHADPVAFEAAVLHSLDRKVCNTLNVCCIPRPHAPILVPRLLAALTRAGERRGSAAKLHVLAGGEDLVPAEWFSTTVGIERAEGTVSEQRAERLDQPDLATEWEWENSPEVTLAIVENVAAAVALANRYSPKLVASLVSSDAAEHDTFWNTIDVPFVGNGFTRWVDGQFALGKPELGLSNWERGRLFARSAVLSGDSVFTVRTRVVQSDPELHR